MSWWEESDHWQHGAWALERRDDELADIAFDGRVVLRSIRAVVRDRDWNTAPLEIARIDDVVGALTLHVRSAGCGSSFAGTIEVRAEGDVLRVTAQLRSARDFATNRTGLVVLHPPTLAGAPLAVTHSDGSVETTAFPASISPHQPVADIAGLAWTTDGATVSLTFDGDVFEMEDQRNWTDASFKTYSRPLALPFPYSVPAGGIVRQSITVRARSAPRSERTRAAPTRLTLLPGGVFPAVGLAAATAPDPAPVPHPASEPAFLLVELDLAHRNWRAALRRAASSGLPLDVRLVLDARDPGAVVAAARALRALPVVRVAAFQPAGDARHVSDADATTVLRAALAEADIDAPVAGGSRSHFTELNRERHRLPADLDALVTTVTPLFHSAGTEQLVESVAIQRLVARQTVEYAGALPVHLGPVSLRPRFNDVATSPQPSPSRDDLAEGYGAAITGAADPRQSAPELAAWTIASAAALAVPGVASVTWFEEWGPRGIRASDGTPYPVADALSALRALGGATLLSGESPDGLVWAVGSRGADGDRMLVANLDRIERALEVEVGGASPRGATLPPGSFARI